MGKYNLNIIDHDSEASSFGVNIVNLTAANMTAQLALLATLRSAVEAVIIGTPRKETVVANVDEIAGVAPANAFAQRETKWLVTGVDGLGLTSSLEIPTADLDALSGGTGSMDITAGVGLALKNALDAVWMSRAGSAVEVTRIIHVGRNI